MPTLSVLLKGGLQPIHITPHQKTVQWWNLVWLFHIKRYLALHFNEVSLFINAYRIQRMYSNSSRATLTYWYSMRVMVVSMKSVCILSCLFFCSIIWSNWKLLCQPRAVKTQYGICWSRSFLFLWLYTDISKHIANCSICDENFAEGILNVVFLLLWHTMNNH